jgi:hypothetical protein
MTPPRGWSAGDLTRAGSVCEFRHMRRSSAEGGTGTTISVKKSNPLARNGKRASNEHAVALNYRRHERKRSRQIATYHRVDREICGERACDRPFGGAYGRLARDDRFGGGVAGGHTRPPFVSVSQSQKNPFHDHRTLRVPIGKRLPLAAESRKNTGCRRSVTFVVAVTSPAHELDLHEAIGSAIIPRAN